MTDDELVAAYLRRLRRATRGLPRARRQELIGEIADHIAQARASTGGQGGSAALRNALDRLGEPEDIVAAAGGTRPAARPGRLEITAVVLLLFGGIAGLVAGIVPVIAGWGSGAVLLWLSSRWRWPDKLLGTLVWPGGIATPFLLMGLATSPQTCGGSSGSAATCGGGSSLPPELALLIAAAAIAAALVVAVRLLSQARRVPEPDEPAASQFAIR
jgi:hypothetical protein